MKRAVSDGGSPPTTSVLITVDVEDWFQVENFRNNIPVSSWASYELRAEKNIHHLLDLYDSVNEKRQDSNRIGTTFFILGWIADRNPEIVREIHRRGHEVASHGFLHELSNQQEPTTFRQDIVDTKKLLEDIVGVQVLGYRAPSFSVSADVLRIVEDCGYVYDSSFNSFAGNKRYGQVDLGRYEKRGVVVEISPSFYEIPISNLNIGGLILPWGGGGYFRLIPSALFQMGIRTMLRKQGAYVFYMHPWEIDPGQPRVSDASVPDRFRHYVNIDKTVTRLRLLLGRNSSASFVSCREYLADTFGIEIAA